jgi:3-phosphoshikimate 1-carboxyvinyltransferase
MMAGESVWPCGESGSTLRFLTPIAGVMGWKGAFKCEGRLASRPQMPFEKKSRYEIAGNVSSQFVSGLLMALPLAEWDSEIAVDGALESSAYVELTEDVLHAAGIKFEKRGWSWKIAGGQRYAIAGRREVEGDWSQAAFFLAMGVEVDGLNQKSRQGDRAVTGLLGQRLVDAAPVPDLIPALAAHAALREGETRFVNCARLRIKESDRLESTCAMIVSVGGKARIEGDSLIVNGGAPLSGGKVRTFGDHRIAMAAAVLACGATAPVVLDDAGVVAKSYPGFWNDFDSLNIIR